MTDEQQLSILVVDDERPILDLLRDILTQGGYRITTADNAAAGLKTLESTPADIVISDYNMPGMTGDQFMAQVKQSYPDTIRVMVSGYADTDVIIRCLNDESIHRFFPKPFIPSEILSSVRLLIKSLYVPDSVSSTRYKILLVEDSKLLRMQMSKLIGARYDLTIVDDGIQAISMSKLIKPDLIITGLNIYGINGFNLIKFIRIGAGLDCPIIIWEDLSEINSQKEAEITEEVDTIIDKTGGDDTERLLKAIESSLG